MTRITTSRRHLGLVAALAIVLASDASSTPQQGQVTGGDTAGFAQAPIHLDAFKRKISRIRQPRLPRPVSDYTADVLNDAMLQFIPQGSDTCVLVFKVGKRRFLRLIVTK